MTWSAWPKHPPSRPCCSVAIPATGQTKCSQAGRRQCGCRTSVVWLWVAICSTRQTTTWPPRSTSPRACYEGGRHVFSGLTDFAYLPREAAVTVHSLGGGRFALPGARASRRLPARYGPAEDVPVEIRGAGQASRQVNNFCSPDAFEADRLVS